ncbi:MAG: gliding motility-associated ABC transporter ATP-binding subunit GldA [Bacteroidetes bacterium]|nr:gliding motility-associated ABC transporter ATP-binding subunit GldA [Bacteroidota bacterium]
MSISVQALSKIYDSQKAVDNISFEVKKGEILGFLGPNGAGKSTTMKMLTCYLPPSSGTATVCGLDIVKAPLEVKQKIGYLPENNPLYYDMYVREFLDFAFQINKQQQASNKEKKIKEVIDLVGLNIEQHKKIGQLSKGYKQRVGLAQALLHNPKILILDEPTSGLDPNQLADIRTLIKNLGKEKTIIFSTHIMQEVQAVCDKVVIINKGKIVANDTADNLQNMIQQEIVVEVEFENAIDENLLNQIQHLLSFKKINDKQFMLYGKNSVALRKAIFEFAMQQHNALLMLKEETGSLENVFHQLTNQTNQTVL